MLDRNTWVHVCRSSDEIPPQCMAAKLKPRIVERLGSTVQDMFPEFAAAFPATAAAMGEAWPRPVLGFYEFRTRWFATLALEGTERNLYFDLGNALYPTEGPDFDVELGMLPVPWRELYRFFWSFSITAEPLPGLRWLNTPFSLASRLDLEQYVEQSGAAPQGAKAFARQVGSQELRCWLATEAGDSLWLDEQRNDRKVYHARGNDLATAVILEDASATLDRYLAHVVAGKPISAFAFRD